MRIRGFKKVIQSIITAGLKALFPQSYRKPRGIEYKFWKRSGRQ